MADSGTRSYTMAAEAAAEIVSQKLDILLSRPELVGCFPVESLVKDAKVKLAMIQVFFSTKGRPAKSTEWEGRLLRVLYHAEEFIDKFHLKVARRRHEALHTATRPLATLVHKCMLLRDMSNLVKAMKELCQDQYLPDKEEAGGEKKKEPASSSFLASAPWEGQKLARLTNFWDRQANFVCQGTLKERIVEWIRKEAEFKPKLVNVYAISILGEEGAGKTFLARWVYGEAMYLGFDMQAWVHVSASIDRREFLFEILKQVDKLARGVMDFYEIKEMLSQKLANKSRFLIVLDDVRWSDQELLDELSMIIQPFSSWGHIITTTQDYRIAGGMNSYKPIELENLDENESKRMLAMKLRRGPQLPSSLQGEDKFLDKIPALPLCISLLGGLLSNDREHAALVINNSAISVSDLLELSYHRLPVHLKPCFIYMALFPVAFPIPTRRLVRLWLAEGLLDSHCCNGGKGKTPEEVGETFILELVARNVIDVVSWRADGSPKACQMLTSLYDLICPAVINTGFLHIHKASKSRGGNEPNPTGQQQQLPDTFPVRWLAEHMNIVSGGHDSSQPNLKLSQVRSFLSFYLRRGMLTKDISTFLENMTSKADYSLLRVLDLEGVYKPSLQGVLRKLVLLKYLGLRSTVLDSIPSEVADLQYLETLDIKHTHITSLPSSLWKARNLRHLHLNWFYIDLKKILKVCGDNVMALTKLQTLSGLITGEVKENSMTGHMNSLTTLKLFLQQSDKDTPGAAGIADWIRFKLTNLQSLTFGVIQEAQPSEEATKEDKAEAQPDAQPGSQPGPTKQGKPESAKEAKPVASQIGLLPGLELDKHHELFELYLLGQLNKPIWTRLLPGSLRVLTLSGSNVKTDMMPELGALLRNLRTLRLLANSFLCETMSFAKDGFPSLKILKIWKLPLLKEVTIEQGAMLHLRELEFRHLDEMKTVEGIEKTVEGIKKCNELDKICVISQSRALVDQLKHQIKEKQLHGQEVTKSPKSLDDKEGDGDEKGVIFYLHIEKKSKSMNGDNRP